MAGRAGDDGHEAVGGQRPRLALQRQRRQGFDRYRVAHQLMGGRPDEDLVWRGGLLQACGGVDRVAGDQRLAVGRVAGYHLSGVDAGSEADGDATVCLELDIQTPQALADLGGRPHRAERVIFVKLRNAEDRHYRIADELLDRPAVALNDRVHFGEVTAHQGAHRLWVELFAKARRARHIGEQDGHRATQSARLQRNRCGALGAELRALGVLGAAGGTHQGHTATLRLTLGSAPHQRRPFARPVMKSARLLSSRPLASTSLPTW